MKNAKTKVANARKNLITVHFYKRKIRLFANEGNRASDRLGIVGLYHYIHDHSCDRNIKPKRPGYPYQSFVLIKLTN